MIKECGFQDDGVAMTDFSESEWGDKQPYYQTLSDLGLIENLLCFPSKNSGRMLCTFTLTITGRIIASVIERKMELKA